MTEYSHEVPSRPLPKSSDEASFSRLFKAGFVVCELCQWTKSTSESKLFASIGDGYHDCGLRLEVVEVAVPCVVEGTEPEKRLSGFEGVGTAAIPLVALPLLLHAFLPTTRFLVVPGRWPEFITTECILV